MKNNFEEEVPRIRARRSRKKPSMRDEAEQSMKSRTDAQDDFYFDQDEDPETPVDIRKIRKKAQKRHQREAAVTLDTGRKPNRIRNRVLKILAMIVVECLTLFGIFSYAYFSRAMNLVQRQPFVVSNVQNQDLSVEDLTRMEEGYWMIAIFGVDSRGTNVGKGTNADVNMICCINRKTGDIKLVSVFRDSYLNISDKNSYNKINAAYAQGGPEQAVKALNKNLDLNITDYITFNWKAVADSINILGGIDMEINRSEFRYINSFITETVKATGIGSHQLKNAGEHHLDGVQAVAYGRLRLMDSDYARTERQRAVIKKAFDKAKVADYTVLNNILVVVLPQVSTSLDFADLTDVALNVTKYHLGDSLGFPMARSDANMGNKGACVIPKTLVSNVTDLHKFLFEEEQDYQPTETVKTISAKIASDTGMYKAAKPQGSASTEGYIPRETTTSETTSRDRDSEYETDEDGNTIEPTNDSGESLEFPGIYETDEDGNPINPSESNPRESTRYPGESTYPLGPTSSSDSRNPSNSSNPSSSTNPTRPSSSNPTDPTSSLENTRPSSPTESSNSDEWTGPGAETTAPTRPSSSTESPTATQPSGPTGPSVDDSDRDIGGSTVITIPPNTEPTTPSPTLPSPPGNGP